MLLLAEGQAAGHRYGGYARLYLARCRTSRYPQRALCAASLAPEPIRRAAVTIIEGVRSDGVATVVDRAFRRLAASLCATL